MESVVSRLHLLIVWLSILGIRQGDFYVRRDSLSISAGTTAAQASSSTAQHSTSHLHHLSPARLLSNTHARLPTLPPSNRRRQEGFVFARALHPLPMA